MDLNIYEVGPRDGLQNSKFSVSTQEKITLIEDLYGAGLTNMEITSFVHPKRVPQMADAEEIFSATKKLNLDVLIPNQRGFDRASKIGAKKFNIFFSPSNEFNMRNLGKTLDEIYPHLQNMLKDTDRENVRAYISCAFGCPFEGKPKEHELLSAMTKAANLANTIVLCDTIGAAHPTLMLQTLQLTKQVDAKVALHLHHSKTSNPFPNIKAALEWGVDTLDSSIGGLGGCPFIPQSGGNLSTNALIHWADNNGYETGIELDNLASATEWVYSKEATS
jgi:hydroxymethylglutaryl-CoA lyase